MMASWSQHPKMTVPPRSRRKSLNTDLDWGTPKTIVGSWSTTSLLESTVQCLHCWECHKVRLHNLDWKHFWKTITCSARYQYESSTTMLTKRHCGAGPSEEFFQFWNRGGSEGEGWPRVGVQERMLEIQLGFHCQLGQGKLWSSKRHAQGAGREALPGRLGVGWQIWHLY